MRHPWQTILVGIVLSVILSACQSTGTPAAVQPVPRPLRSPIRATPVPSLPVATPESAQPVAETAAALPALPVYTYRIINAYPHDPEAFTQGLAYVDGALYEGTGRYGQSTLREVDLRSGAVLRQHSLAADVFGEGIAVVGDRIIQLTWQSQRGFVYDRTRFEPVGQWSYTGEGWGLTFDGTALVMSDGTATLRFLDPQTLQTTGQLEVSDAQGLVTQLNELEYVNGEIWANVWRTDRIARIDASTGRVVGWIDLTGLLGPADRGAEPVDVLNGIAYDPATDRVFVTGKLWPKLFEIEVVPEDQP